MPAATKSPQGKTAVRSALIAAGIELFSERGLRAVSVRDLAERAGVNHSLLFRHFGNKHNLIRAVFEQRLHNLDLAVADRGLAGGELLEAAIRAIMKDPQLWRLLTFAALEGEEELLHSVALPVFGDTLNGLRQQQRGGQIYGGVEAEVLLGSAFALGLGWAVFRRLLMDITGSHGRRFEDLRVQVDRMWEDLLAMPSPGDECKMDK